MKTLLVNLCAAQLLMSGQGDALSRLVEAYAALLASPEVRVEDLRAMETTGRWFSLPGVATSEGTVVQDSLKAVEAFARTVPTFASDGAQALRAVVETELARRSSIESEAQNGRNAVGRNPMVSRERRIRVPSRMTGIFFSRDSQAIVAPLSEKQSIARWNLADDSMSQTLEHPLRRGTEYMAAYAPVPGHLFVKADVGSTTVRVFDTATLEKVQEFEAIKGGGGIAVSHDATQLLVHGNPSYLYGLEPGAKPKLLGPIVQGDGIRYLMPGGDYFASLSANSQLTVGDLWDTPRYVAAPHPEGVEYDAGPIAFAGSKPHIAICNPNDPTIRIWNWKRRKEVRRLSPGGGLQIGGYRAVDYSADGKWIAAVQWRDSPLILVWNAQNGQLVASWRAGLKDNHFLAFSPNGLILATASNGFPSIDIWNLEKRLERP